MSSVRPDPERVQGQSRIVDRAGRAGQVEDEIDVLVELDVVGHVVIEEDEAVVADVLDVLQVAGVEVVDADDAQLLGEERFAQMGAEKPGSAGYDGGWHAEIISRSRTRAASRRGTAAPAPASS